ncbi:50S ribosomal protein L17 [Peptococcaceae bacterium CEB3]|nr:50S ribosomal protein L17 [Peptococcaceae bacterium CEB3]
MAYRKLGRNTGHRSAMLRNIVTSLFKHERIETTAARAKELNAVAEKLITLGKQGDLAARRQAMAYMLDEDTVKKLFETIAPQYDGRQGGYTRTMKLGNRRGDAAEMVLVELVK